MIGAAIAFGAHELGHAIAFSWRGCGATIICEDEWHRAVPDRDPANPLEQVQDTLAGPVAEMLALAEGDVAAVVTQVRRDGWGALTALRHSRFDVEKLRDEVGLVEQALPMFVANIAARLMDDLHVVPLGTLRSFDTALRAMRPGDRLRLDAPATAEAMTTNTAAEAA